MQFRSKDPLIRRKERVLNFLVAYSSASPSICCAAVQSIPQVCCPQWSTLALPLFEPDMNPLAILSDLSHRLRIGSEKHRFFAGLMGTPCIEQGSFGDP